MQSQGAELEEREYGKQPLTETELQVIIGDGPVKDFLNTRTPLYRERGMKDNPPTKEEAIRAGEGLDHPLWWAVYNNAGVIQDGKY